ncbi:MAG TPA: PAS domain S-box protein, partial [Pyrinomonadaceae bacterium]|nr:PAS domain S-box protein [Pyrinomonadaceae bacterium]
DSDDLRAVFSTLLKRAGYETLNARSGAECLRIVAENPPDLVLLDVILPDMTGVDVCKAIKGSERSAGVLVLNISGVRTSAINEIEGLEGGADGYITKPIDGRTLIAHVNALLRMKRAEQEIEAAREELENKVLQRTAELVAANTFLQQEIADRKRVEDALKEAEEKYRGIFENAIEGIFQSTPDGRFISANPALARMFGYDSADQLISDRKNIEREHYVDPQRRKVFKKLIEQIGFVRDFELQAYRKDGSIIWTSENVRAVRDESGTLLYYEGIVEDVTRRKEVEEERLELLRRLVRAQEDEQRRISRELHDQMGQSLAALLLGLKSLKDAVPGERAKEQVQRLQDITSRIADEMHSLIRELRPTALDDLGLHTALANYIEEWSQQSTIAADFHANGLLNGRLDSQLESTVYRIVQEALNNVMKHAQAQSVSVILEKRGSRLSVIVEDDGIGFDVEGLMKIPASNRRFGLLGMQERVMLVNGSFNIESTPGLGTTVLVHIDTSRNMLEAE